MNYFLGVVTGFIISILIIVIVSRKKYLIEQQLDILESGVIPFSKKSKGYIAGLSEEEQSFKENLLEKDDTKVE